MSINAKILPIDGDLDADWVLDNKASDTEVQKGSSNVEQTLEDPETGLIWSLVLRFPEMRWLTWDVEATPEATYEAADKKNIWEKIFPWLSKKELTEFNRTSVGILCLYWAYEGWDEWYKKLTECQTDEELKLTRENFEDLHEYTKSILPNEEDFNTLIVYTVINDLWKISSVMEQIQVDASKEFSLRNINLEKTIDALVDYTVRNSMEKIAEIVELIHNGVWELNVDHDKVLLKWLKQDAKISPSFSEIWAKDQEQILTGLSAEFNMGQFLQSENLPANLDKLKWIDEKSYDFYMAHFLFDLAWAAWQFVQNGSAVLDNATYEGFKDWNKVLKDYINWNVSDIDAYNWFLALKAAKLWIDIKTKKNYALTKIACMTRVKTLNQMDELINIFEWLGNNTKEILIKELNETGTWDQFWSLLYYSPALLGNVQQSLWKKEVSKEESLSLGLTTVARIFQEARVNQGWREWWGVFTVMLKEIAAIGASNPESLRELNFEFKQVWDDTEVWGVENTVIDLWSFEWKRSITSIEKEIPGKRVALGWISKWLHEVAQIAQLLESNNKEVPFIFSIKNKWSSIWADEDEVMMMSDIYVSYARISGEYVKNYSIYIDEWEEPSSKIESIITIEGGVDTIIWVDAWWSTLHNDEWIQNQDLQALKGIDDVSNVKYSLSCQIAIWIDSPKDVTDVINAAKAIKYSPTEWDIQSILEYYKQLEEGKESSRVSLAWEKALQDEFWVQELDIPVDQVINDVAPISPFVNLQPADRDIFFMTTGKHLEAIGRGKEVNSLFL